MGKVKINKMKNPKKKPNNQPILAWCKWFSITARTCMCIVKNRRWRVAPHNRVEIEIRVWCGLGVYIVGMCTLCHNLIHNRTRYKAGPEPCCVDSILNLTNSNNIYFWFGLKIHHRHHRLRVWVIVCCRF